MAVVAVPVCDSKFCQGVTKTFKDLGITKFEIIGEGNGSLMMLRLEIQLTPEQERSILMNADFDEVEK